MKKIKWMMLLVAIMGGVGCNESSQDTVSQDVIMEEDTKEVLEVYGTVEAYQTTQINVEFPAKVEKIHVKNGELVKQGDVILTIDTSEYMNQILKKEKELKGLKIKYEAIGKSQDVSGVQINDVNKNIEIKNKILTEQIDPQVVELKNKISSIEEEIKRAEQEQIMHKELLEVGGISQQEVDENNYNIDIMKTDIQNIENQIEKILLNQKLEIEGLQTSLKTYEVQRDNEGIKETLDKDILGVEIEVAELELAEMKNKLIGSSINENNIIANQEKSIIQELDIKVGQQVGGGQNMICTLVTIDDLVGIVNVPQAFATQIKKGNKAFISATGNTKNTLEGEVTNISEYAFKENGENMVAVTVKIPKEQEILKLGYEINVAFNLE